VGGGGGRLIGLTERVGKMDFHFLFAFLQNLFLVVGCVRLIPGPLAYGFLFGSKIVYSMLELSGQGLQGAIWKCCRTCVIVLGWKMEVGWKEVGMVGRMDLMEEVVLDKLCSVDSR
jgi:hypothetical protein